MAKWQFGTGIVVSFRYVGPAAPAPQWHWTAIIVDLDTGRRISALLPPKVAKQNLIVVGDRISLEFQPGQEAGIGGIFGRKKGLCRNIELVENHRDNANEFDTDSGELPTYQLFISHASEDKESFVRPLAYALRNGGLSIWYDEFSIGIGDSLRRNIDHGLERSERGLIVLSHSFFRKEWPKRELDGMFSLMESGQRQLLPIWHNLSLKDVKYYAPTLADIVAISSSDGVDAVVSEVIKVCRS